MTKRPPPGKCVYCLQEFDQLTWDHILPKSWYPDRSNNVEKWKVPACNSCNNKFGKIEKDLFLRLAMCIEPNDPNTSGIVDRAFRSINPAEASNEKDRVHRLAARGKLMRNIKFSSEISSEKLLPNFEPTPGAIYAGNLGIPMFEMNQEEIDFLANKIVRGFVYIKEKTYITREYEIKADCIDQKQVVKLASLGHAIDISFNLPGISIGKQIVQRTKFCGIYLIDIWQKLWIRAFVTEKGFFENIIESVD